MTQSIDIKNLNIPTETLQLITAEYATENLILPLKKKSDAILFYISKTKKNVIEIQNELEVFLNSKIELIPVEDDIIQQLISKFYRKNISYNYTQPENSTSDDFIINLIEEANNIGSSDIHIETYENLCRIRFRIDGKLLERYNINLEEYPVIINKIKIKANLDITEKRLPQDGRIFYQENNKKFDIRVSVLPTLYGEKIVLRLLSKDTTKIEITELGFNEQQLNDYLEGIRRPYGLVLISGPTGSGKTTTLYATLKILNTEQTNILTIEDPIEYTLNGINQVQLKESIGLTFANALRTFLRQDPDIIMIGEIRDTETAQMAIRASLTGHLVLSTIHTNSAWGTIPRLIDMGIPPYLLAQTLNLTVSQRLVRLLCPNCKDKKATDASIFPKNLKLINLPDYYYVPVGCKECYFTGYKGRKAIYEVILITNELSDYIKHGQPDIKKVAEDKGIITLVQSALNIFYKGETSIDEIYPILSGN